jgi:type IV pilus assembly protein PilA
MHEERPVSLRRNEDGYSLIELMVVVMILGILVALALPTFLGARTRAQDRAAQASLRTGIAAARVCLTDSRDYAPCDAAALEAVDTSVTWLDAPQPSVASTTVSTVHTPNVWAGAAMSDSGTCWLMQDDLAAELTYGSAVVAVCDGAMALGVSGNAW